MSLDQPDRTGPPVRGRGRPRTMSQEDRRRRLLAAAEAVFLAQGYHDATMDDVAQAAAMSKKTLYQNFSSKAVLFETMLIETFQAPAAQTDDSRPAMVHTLTRLLHDLVETCLSPRNIALTRLMIAEAPRSNDMADALSRMIGNGALDKWLERQVMLGHLTPQQADQAASRLFFAVAGETMLHRLLGLPASPCGVDAERRISDAVNDFFAPKLPKPSRS